jgi:putative spermidine/putrescine transport system permease protein
LTSAGNPAVDPAARPLQGGRRLPLTWLGVTPFFVYVGLFLVLPSAIVAAGSFTGADGSVTLANVTDIQKPYIGKAFLNSFIVSIASALIGATLGALLAYAVATGNPRGALRRIVTSASGVLAQFGGVTLAFVYTYFQIPLMVLVFLPALDGIRPQWREATESLGGSTWHYWRHVAGPLLAPAFLGCTLLLFANAFSAYATVAALITQGGIVVPLQISNLFTSETGRAQPGLAKALALAMIVVVTVVMLLYTLLQRRTSRWLR